MALATNIKQFKLKSDATQTSQVKSSKDLIDLKSRPAPPVCQNKPEAPPWTIHQGKQTKLATLDMQRHMHRHMNRQMQ